MLKRISSKCTYAFLLQRSQYDNLRVWYVTVRSEAGQGLSTPSLLIGQRGVLSSVMRLRDTMSYQCVCVCVCEGRVKSRDAESLGVTDAGQSQSEGRGEEGRKCSQIRCSNQDHTR